MNLYASSLLVISVVCVTVGLQHLLIATRIEKRQVRLLFSVAAFAAAADALLETRLFRSTTPAEFQSLMPWTAVFICTFLAALAWFIALRTGAARRWLLLAETGVLAAAAVLDHTLPTGIAYLEIEGLREVMLPWGEAVRFAVGEPTRWRIVGDIANVGFLIFLLDTTIRLVRRGERREAWLIGGSLFVLSVSVLAIIPTDLGLVGIPATHPFAFLLIVAAMSWDLSDTVVREARLSREVVANERRWRQFIDSVQLLAVSLDREGKIVSLNPFAERVWGYAAADVVGRHYLDFVPAGDREEVTASVEGGLRGDPESGNERVLITRQGEQRIVRWRSVVLREAEGEVEGLLSVGADVTESRQSEEELRRTAAELERTVAELEELRSRLEEEVVSLREEIASEHGFEEIVGSSDPLLYVLHKVKQVAPTDATVLIHGETGVGKELVARAIHRESGRSGQRFVAVNCAALPPNLVESELFGHERGAFTGAERRREGRFELADGGTLLLDEVGELPAEVQPKLLRVLQDGEFERVGGSATLRVNVRVIAATNRDLRNDVEDGRFREDLYYRLEVYPITIPPLRDRREDIAPLVQHFVRQIAGRRGVRIDEVPAELMRRLEAYDWPGNVRELQNVVERAVLVSTGGVLRLAEPLAEPAGAPRARSAATPPRPTLEELQRDYISEVLEACGGRIAGAGGAADVLGLHPNTLRSRMKKLGVKSPKSARRRVD
jgi:chemotaxis protein methyltransferase CheR